MKLQKGVISLLAGLSVLAAGIFTSCGNPSGAEKGNEKEGIVLSWEDMPENTKHIRIENLSNGRNYTVFEINDLSKYNSVTDEYVDEGKDYEYRIVYLDEDYRWIKASDWFTVKAEGGSGELSFSATATTDGIKLASSDIPENFEWIWAEKIEKNSKKSERIYIYQKDNDGSFTDKFVTAGMEYEYKLQVQVGYNSYTNNEGSTPIVEYPRFKTVNVTASAGSGSVEIKTLPAINYNADAKTMTLTQKPEFADNNITYWYMNIEYYNGKNGNWSFADFNSEDSDETPSMQIKTVPDGLWNFNDCWFCLTFEKNGKSAFRYDFGIYEAPEIPQTIGLNVDKLFMPIATPTDDGIKIEWKNLPENTKKLEVRDANNGNTLFEVNDLSTVTSVTDKYVTKGSRYEYYLIAKYENGNWLQESDFVPVFASAGQNERTVTILPTDAGIKISGEKTTGTSYFEIDRFSKGENRNIDYYALNARSEQSDTSYELTDIFVNKGQEYEYRIYERIGFHSRTIGGAEIPPDPLIEYPRYTNVFVKATGGSGPVKILNEPEATFTDGQVNFSIKPQIQTLSGLGYWNFEFNYHCKTLNRNWSLYGYWANIIKDEVWDNTQNAPSGTWELEQYWINLAFETYSYTQYNNNLEKLSKLPEIITL